MADRHSKGINCYHEYFAPTIAYADDLTTFFYQHPLYCPRFDALGKLANKKEEMGVNDVLTVQRENVAHGCTVCISFKSQVGRKLIVPNKVLSPAGILPAFLGGMGGESRNLPATSAGASCGRSVLISKYYIR